MDVFISFSGRRSEAMAEALKWFIPKLINAANPWLSKASIGSGKLWRIELAQILQSAKFGIFCLTPESLDSKWLFYEAGAISKTLDDAHVCPLLIDLKQSDVQSPLSDFQCRTADREGILLLMQSVNAALGTESINEAQLNEMFEILWPMLKEKIAALPSDNAAPKPQREVRDIAEEILNIVRTLTPPATEAIELIPHPRRQNLPSESTFRNTLRATLAVREWLVRIHSDGKVIENRGFPDFIVQRQDGRHLGYEVKIAGSNLDRRIREILSQPHDQFDRLYFVLVTTDNSASASALKFAVESSRYGKSSNVSVVIGHLEDSPQGPSPLFVPDFEEPPQGLWAGTAAEPGL
jgi:hypothetical protein